MNYQRWLYARFPEELYPCRADRVEQYNAEVLEGLKRASQLKVSICGLGRNIAHVLPLNIYRMEELGSLFGEARFYVYENDSTDGTPEILKDWAGPKVKVRSEKLGYGPLEQNRSAYRTGKMAAARNKLLQMIEKKTDYVILADIDLLGGWSYEGAMQSLFYLTEHGWDMVGSNSIILHPENGGFRSLFYDSWAYREWDFGLHPDEEINQMKFCRGDDPRKTYSNFGGFAIYRWESLMDLTYEETYTDGPLSGESDCEHCILHWKMRKLGRTELYLNPSQITLYNKYRF